MKQVSTLLIKINKGFILFSLFFIGLSSSCFSQTSVWKWQNPLPQGNTLYDLHFVDSGTGWAVGEVGTIIKTSNGGQSWEIQNSGTLNRLSAVHFIDTLTGWAVGFYGTMVKTENGGQSWHKQEIGTQQSLTSIFFIDSLTGWVAGNSGTILKTTNSGQTWQISTTGADTYFDSMFFTDGQTGWGVSNSSIMMKTTNGGSTWTNQYVGPTNNHYSIYFADSLNGWTVGSGQIVKTTNGGESWVGQSGGSGLKSICFIDAQNGWATGDKSKIIRTTNGGQNWVIQNAASPNYVIDDLYSIQFVTAQKGWAVGYGGIIYHTTNGGQTWENILKVTRDNLNSVHFIDAQTGWATAENGNLFKTSNGGQLWQIQNTGTNNTLNSIQFINSQTGWLAGNSGTILKTTNAGQLWQIQNSGTTNNLVKVHFSDTVTGWAVGYSGTILKTSNGGQSWQNQTSGTTNYLTAIHFADAQIGWAVGDSGTILKTTNGGQSWQNQNIGNEIMLRGVRFINALTGWATGFYGTFLKTTNGGLSWQSLNIGTQEFYSSVYFLDSQNGWAVGYRGKIMTTSDGGENWLIVGSGTAAHLNDVHFPTQGHGWAVGDLGAILTFVDNRPIYPQTPSSIRSGKIFQKTTTDCNPSNVPVPATLVKALPGPHFGISGPDGNFSLRVPVTDTIQTFTIQPVISTNAFQTNIVCPPSGQIAVTIDTIADTLSGHNFGVEITACHHLGVQLSSNRRRRCFTNRTTVSFWNEGALPSPDAYIMVQFPHWVMPVSASIPYVAVNDSVWRFNVGSVAAGTGGNFSIIDSVRCGQPDILGLSQCTKATIYPAPDCPNPANWSGAEVSASGQCKNGLVKLGMYNRTNVDMTDSVDFWIFLDSIQVKTGKVKLAAGDSLLLQVTPSGMGVYLSVNQVANHPQEVFASIAVEGCGFVPMALSHAVSTHFPNAQLPNSKTQCLPVLGALDPNDKQVFPIGFTNQNVIKPDTRLEYLVRFQNTGNDTAFTVYVIDTLDENLSIETFEMGAASHPYQLSMQTEKSGKTHFIWKFENIMLPDSNASELNSNGFIQFRISPKPGLPLGAKVRNHANIYFDFNPPVITNETLTTFDNLVFTDPTLDSTVQVVSVSPQINRKPDVQIFPNPAEDLVTIVCGEKIEKVVLVDVLGIETETVLSAKNQIHLEKVKPGMYWLKMKTRNGWVVRKLSKL